MRNVEIENIFTYHPPTDSQVHRYDQLRQEARDLALMIQDYCPDSREKALAITNLQQAIMWANASIAINESNGNVFLTEESRWERGKSHPRGGHIASMPEPEKKE